MAQMGGGDYSITHGLLAGLRLQAVVTTNYDTLFEAACAGAQARSTSASRPPDRRMASCDLPRSPCRCASISCRTRPPTPSTSFSSCAAAGRLCRLPCSRTALPLPPPLPRPMSFPRGGTSSLSATRHGDVDHPEDIVLTCRPRKLEPSDCRRPAASCADARRGPTSPGARRCRTTGRHAPRSRASCSRCSSPSTCSLSASRSRRAVPLLTTPP